MFDDISYIDDLYPQLRYPTGEQITREEADAFALRSQSLTAKAQADGLLAEEIVPVEYSVSKKEKAILAIDEEIGGSSTAADQCINLY